MSFLAPLTNYTLLVPLTPSQLDLRRSQLDSTGHLAWFSPLFLYVSLAPTLSLLSATLPRKPVRRATWLLTTPISAEFGTLQTVLLTLTYTTYLLVLTFRHTGSDYMHLTKAFGHVAVSQLPWQYALAIKSPWNPLQWLLRCSHEEMNALHRGFGRMVHGLLATHAVLYLNFFIRINVLETALGRTVVRLGIVAFWAFNFIALLSIPMVRRRGYHRVFYQSHVVLSAVVLPLLYFHVRYTRKYIWQAGALYLFNGVTRGLTSSPKVSVRVEAIEGTSLLRLTADGKASAFLSNWTAGQHVYLKHSNSPMHPKTPFTIVAYPGSPGNASESASIDLVIRNLHGPQTGWLAQQKSATLQLEGPYGTSKTYLPRLLTERTDDPVLLVAGGVGVTYTLPIYLALLAHYRSSMKISFVWFVRSIREVWWVMEMLGRALCDVDVDIYITGEGSGKVVELGTGNKGFRVYGPEEREHVAEVVDRVFRKGKGRVYVLACGPGGMAMAVRTEVGFHVMRDGREVVFHEEQFGLGGSQARRFGDK